jgi:hypothetical protein
MATVDISLYENMSKIAQNNILDHCNIAYALKINGRVYIKDKTIDI